MVATPISPWQDAKHENGITELHSNLRFRLVDQKYAKSKNLKALATLESIGITFLIYIRCHENLYSFQLNVTKKKDTPKDHLKNAIDISIVSCFLIFSMTGK